MSKTKLITIVGGYGAMGQLFTTHLSSLGHQVVAFGESDWACNDKVLTQSDLVIICVPIATTLSVIKRVAKIISKDTILVDLTSTKVLPMQTMLDNHAGAVLGLHPVFGPTITSTQNQIIVSCSGRYSVQYQWFLDDLLTLGFSLKAMSAVEHDQIMDFVQGLEHFMTFSLGSFLHHKNIHPQKLIEVASPIYLTKLLLLGRIFDQDARLYANIISSDETRIKLLEEFSLWFSKWVQAIKHNKLDEFIAEFESTSLWMGEFTSYAQDVSDEFLNKYIK